LILPFLKALMVYTVLRFSIFYEGLDGLLCFFPAWMDFDHCYVENRRNCNQVKWRLERIIQENLIMAEVHKCDYAFEQHKFSWFDLGPKAKPKKEGPTERQRWLRKIADEFD